MSFLKLSVQCRKKPNFTEQIAEQTASRTAIPYAVFEHLKLLWMRIWQHIHTVTTTDVSPDLG